MCRVQVYHHATQRIEDLMCTDPYSKGLAADGERSLFVDVAKDPALEPQGWYSHAVPPLAGAVFT